MSRLMRIAPPYAYYYELINKQQRRWLAIGRDRGLTPPDQLAFYLWHEVV